MTRAVTFEGKQYTFPDDATDAEISQALTSMHPAPSQAPAPQQQPQAQRGQSRDPRLEAAGGAAALAQGLTFGFGDEMTGALGALGAAGDAALHGRFSDIPRAAGEGYNRERNRTLALLQDFRARRPNVANFTQGTGAAVPILMTGGAAAAPETALPASRGVGAFLNQTARGAAAGGVYGATAGFGSTDGDLQSRLQGANQGALMGAAVGAAAPAAINTASAALGPLTRLARRIPTPEPNSVGAMGRPMRVPRPAPTPAGPQIPPPAIGTIERLADRSQMSPDAVDSAFRAARANPQGQVVADVFGDPGLRTTRAIAQAPGQTGARASEVARQRFGQAAQRIVTTLQRSLGVGESRTAAMERLGRQYDQASNDLYKPVLAQQLPAEASTNITNDVGHYVLEDPIMKQALSRANGIFNRDRLNGVVSGRIDDHLARFMHYIKMGLDAAITAERRNPTGLQATELRGVMQMRQRFVQTLDNNIPGYREARQQWGGLASAEEALSEGADFVKMLPEEVQARVREMTPFELHHARIGLADEIRHMTRGGVNRNKNVTIPLDDPDIQASIAAVYDTPEQAAHFLETVNTQYRLLDNARQWGTGSPTYSNVMHGADEHLNTLAEMGGHAMTGNVAGAARRGAQHVMNAVTGGALERANNVRGEALMTRIDTPESQAFANEVVRILRQRAAARAGRANVAQLTARGAGTAAGQRRK